MKNYFSALVLLLFLAQTTWAQTLAIKGKLTDKITGEGLAGASVQITNENTNTGGLTEVNGTFKIENLKPGKYNVTATYIGFKAETQTVTLTDKDVFATFKLGEDNSTLNEVEIVADVAVERETPVAFSAIKESTIKESLAGRDLPMILNETPGVYATQSGGGTGDSKISIRGFSQNNIAVLVNGVPVNDMENGSVYWSNWDLSDVTKSIQVQRGLSASKLATPSVGGTMNVLTKGFENKRSVIARQELGSKGYTKTSLMLSSGKLNGDWSVTAYGSRRQGDGWVQGTFDDSYSYFANISKRMGNHTLSLTGLGSPQKHGQRTFHGGLYKTKEYSTEKALELGVTDAYNPDGSPKGNYGFNYNFDYGPLNRYTISGNDTTHNREDYNGQQNYYHKPQINLNHFWTLSEKLFVSNVIYASIGNGGGQYVASKNSIGSKNGHADYQSLYNSNYRNGVSSSVARASVNNHRWYGFISGLDYKATERTTLSLGIDGRTYKGEHYAEVRDLLGGQYTTMKSAALTGNNNLDENKKLFVGDKFGNTYDGIVKYLGGFAMAEYKSNVISAFISGTVSKTFYNRINYSRAKVYNINGNDIALNYNALYTVGANNYTPADYIILPDPTPNNAAKDTTLLLSPNSPVRFGQKTYQQTPDQGNLVESTPVSRMGYSVKGGVNYNLNEFNNIFFNAGYISRAPFIDFIFSRTTGEKIPNAHNENIISFEVGYGVSQGNFKSNLNGYYTIWKDKSTTTSLPSETDPGRSILFNISGMNARHTGVELDLAQGLSRKLELNAAISLGDWRWTSSGEARGYNEDGSALPVKTIYAKGVHVGGSAQTQFMVGMRYEPIQGLYIRPTYTLFAKNYTNFNPDELTSKVPQDSYRLPSSRTIDLHSGYSFKFYKDLKLSLNGSILNLLNEYYITDVDISTTPNDPNLASVFFNRGRTFILGASVSF